MGSSVRRVASVIAILALVAAGCTSTSPTGTALDEDDDVGPTTIYLYLDPTTTIPTVDPNTVIGANPGGIIESVSFVDAQGFALGSVSTGESVVAPLKQSSVGGLLILVLGSTCSPRVEVGAPALGRFTVDVSGAIQPDGVTSCSASLNRYVVEAILMDGVNPLQAEFEISDSRVGR